MTRDATTAGKHNHHMFFFQGPVKGRLVVAVHNDDEMVAIRDTGWKKARVADLKNQTHSVVAESPYLKMVLI